MQLVRRTVLIGAGVFVATPALAQLLASASDGAARVLPDPALLPPLADDAAPTEPVFRIDGWSERDADAGDALWFAVGPAWRTAWR